MVSSFPCDGFMPSAQVNQSSPLKNNRTLSVEWG
jgi:hypothetical protein